MRRKIGTILLIIYTLFTVFMCTGYWYSQYYTPDTRYLRDDLEYLSGRIVEAEIMDEPVLTHGFNAIKHPKGLAAYEIYVLENLWVNGSLKGIEVDLDGKEGAPFDQTKVEPIYDTLDRLALDTYNEDIGALYGLIYLDIGEFHPDTEITELQLNSWYTVRQKYVDDAFEAMERLRADMIHDLII